MSCGFCGYHVEASNFKDGFELMRDHMMRSHDVA